MTSRRPDDLFHRALELSGEEQQEFLDRECADDDALRQRVEELIRADAIAGDFADRPALEAFPELFTPDPEPSLVGTTIESFRVVSRIASGGMGTVYEAIQDHPRRRVALKVMRSDLSSPSLLRRFGYEANVLARLQHPGVAHVYEAGIHESGGSRIPYIAMEYIHDALPITAYASREGSTIRDRIQLFVKVCDAVHHGHQKGIIHRDLKPANILVDRSGQPKVIDFGVARAVDFEVQTTVQTEFGNLLGTIQYMSPEQTTGNVTDLDTRTDVYSLGVVLYELLCGQLPYDVSRLPIPQATTVIQEQPPRRLSSHLRTLRGDLETITRKALEKDRERRYASAAHLGQDLRRFLNREPIQARPPSLVYQLCMFARRHKLASISVSLAAIALVSTVAISTLFAYRAERSRAREALQAYLASIAVADTALRGSDVMEARRRLERASPELRNWEWWYLSGQLDRSSQTLHGPEGFCVAVDLSSSGSEAVAGWAVWTRKESSVSVFDLATGVERVRYGPFSGIISALDLSPDEMRLAWGTQEGTATLWDMEREQTIWSSNEPMKLASVSFGPRGRILACGGQDGVRLWQFGAEPRATSLPIPGEFVRTVAFDATGQRLATGGGNGVIRIWNSAAGTIQGVLKGHAGAITAVAWNPDGRSLASGSVDSTVRVWDPDTAEERIRFVGHRQEVSSVAWSADGAWVLSGSHDRTLKVWSPISHEERATHVGHTSLIRAIAVSRSTNEVASASMDGTVKIWSLGSLHEGEVLGAHTALVRTLAFDPRSRRLAAGDFEGSLRIYDLASSQEVRAIEGHEDSIMQVAFSPDGVRLASASNDGTIKLWNPDTGDLLATLRGHDSGVSTVAFSPDGDWIASGSTDETAILWSARSLEQVRVLQGESWLWALAFDPDSRVLVTAWGDGFLRSWNLDTGDERLAWRAHSDSTYCVDISPDGTALVSGSRDGTITLWDAQTGNELARLEGHSMAVQAVAFSPDGTRIASASDDTTVRLWDRASGEEAISLRGHGAWVFTVAFGPGGRFLASGGGNYQGVGCSIRLWDAGEQFSPARH